MKLSKETIAQHLPVSKYLSVLLPEIRQERAQKFTNIVLTLIGAGIFGIFAVGPTISTIANLQKQLSDETFVNEQLKTKIANLSALQLSYKQIQNDLPVVLAALPQNANAPILAAQLQAVARQKNVKLLNIEVFQVELTKAAASNKASLFTFAFTAQGNKDNIVSFVTLLSTMQRILTFDTISVTKNAGGSLTLTAQGSAYFKQ